MSIGNQEETPVTKASSEISIRSATLQDVDALCALARQCIEHMRRQGIDQWDELYPSRHTFEDDVRSGTAVVAIKDSEIVGVIVLNDTQEPEYADVAWQFLDGPVAVVHRLMIQPALEGQGLARALMRHIENRAWTSGYQTIRLDAFEANPRACTMYERLGYLSAGRVRFRKGYFKCFERLAPCGV